MSSELLLFKTVFSVKNRHLRRFLRKKLPFSYFLVKSKYYNEIINNADHFGCQQNTHTNNSRSYSFNDSPLVKHFLGWYTLVSVLSLIPYFIITAMAGWIFFNIGEEIKNTLRKKDTETKEKPSYKPLPTFDKRKNSLP